MSADVNETPETGSDERLHVLDETCWCNPVVELHVLDETCWCNPVVESYARGRRITHEGPPAPPPSTSE